MMDEILKINTNYRRVFQILANSMMGFYTLTISQKAPSKMFDRVLK